MSVNCYIELVGRANRAFYDLIFNVREVIKVRNAKYSMQELNDGAVVDVCQT